MSDRQAIKAALQQGYGDASQTVLDDRVAGDVLSTLRERGWASLQEVAMLIIAAGGEIRVSDHDMMRTLDNLQVTVHEDFENRERVFRVVPRS